MIKKSLAILATTLTALLTVGTASADPASAAVSPGYQVAVVTAPVNAPHVPRQPRGFQVQTNVAGYNNAFSYVEVNPGIDREDQGTGEVTTTFDANHAGSVDLYTGVGASGNACAPNCSTVEFKAKGQAAQWVDNAATMQIVNPTGAHALATGNSASVGVNIDYKFTREPPQSGDGS